MQIKVIHEFKKKEKKTESLNLKKQKNPNKDMKKKNHARHNNNDSREGTSPTFNLKYRFMSKSVKEVVPDFVV